MVVGRLAVSGGMRPDSCGGSIVGKHTNTRHNGGRRALLVAAATASLLAGWASPVAHADGGAGGANSGGGATNNSVSDAVQHAIGSVQKSFNDFGGSLQRSTKDLTKAGTDLMSNMPKSSVSSSGGALTSSRATETPRTAAVQPKAAAATGPAGVGPTAAAP